MRSVTGVLMGMTERIVVTMTIEQKEDIRRRFRCGSEHRSDAIPFVRLRS